MADKQQAQAALVNAIADGVHAKLATDFTKLAEQVSKLTVTCNSICVRLDTLDAAVATGGAAAKRTVRGAGAAKGAAAKKTASKAASADDEIAKVTNSLLYFRYALKKDLDDYQATFGTEENVAEAEKDAAVGKKDRDKNPEEWWSAVGAALWKLVLSDEQKKEIRGHYDAWKENLNRDAAEPQLDEDAAADE